MDVGYCRLCLAKSNDLLDIFYNPSVGYDYQSKIYKLFSFQMEPTDPYKYVCKQCLKHVVEFYPFHIRVMESQLKLSLVLKHHCNVICKEEDNVPHTAVKNEPNTDSLSNNINWNHIVNSLLRSDQTQKGVDIDKNFVVSLNNVSDTMSVKSPTNVLVKVSVIPLVKIPIKPPAKQMQPLTNLMEIESKNPLETMSSTPLIKTSANSLINLSANPLVSTSANSLINPSANPLKNPSANPLVKTSANPLIKMSANSLVKLPVSLPDTADNLRKSQLSLVKLPGMSGYTLVKPKNVDIIVSKEVLRKEMKIKTEDDHTDDDSPLSPKIENFEFPQVLYDKRRPTVVGKARDTLIRHFYNIQCTECPDVPQFGTLMKLESHFTKVHKSPPYLTCFCEVRLNTEKEVYLHMAKHLQPSAFECTVCKKDFDDVNKQILHVSRHVYRFKCQDCDKRFTQKYMLKYHWINTHGPAENRIKKKHTPKKNTEKKHLCVECGESFGYPSFLKAHIITKHKPVKVKCKICGKMCRNSVSLNYHVRSLHLNKVLRCRKCLYHTINQKRFDQHMQKGIHTKKKYSCHICGKIFNFQLGLQDHMNQHTGNAIYNCPFCPKTFMSSGNFYAHRKRMHLVEFEDTKKKVKKENIDTETPDSKSS